jgi:hypothetical protein
VDRGLERRRHFFMLLFEASVQERRLKQGSIMERYSGWTKMCEAFKDW